MIVRMQQKRGSVAEWTAANTVLLEGEFGWDEENDILKIGDGVTHWLDLPIHSGGAVGRVAFVENRSGTVTYSTGPGAPIEGMMIAVPPSSRDLRVEWGATTGMAVGGEGAIQTLLIETTGGGGVVQGICAKKYESNNLASAQGFTHEGRASGLGSSAVWRTFQLLLGHYSSTGSSIVGYVTNGDTNYSKTYLFGEYV
jgi:hypothetical protein